MSLPPQGGMTNTTAAVKVLGLSKDSLMEKEKHDSMVLELEVKKRAHGMVVPTLAADVRAALREMGRPVRLFGENLADVRDRLRTELARLELLKERGTLPPMDGMAGLGGTDGIPIGDTGRTDGGEGVAEEDTTTYTEASESLIQVREKIALFSFEKARARLIQERRRRTLSGNKRARLEAATNAADSSGSSIVKVDKRAGNRIGGHGDENDDDEAEISKLDDDWRILRKSLRGMTLEGSQYADERALSAIAATTDRHGLPIVATGSWSATIKLWDGSSSELRPLGNTTMAHEDRITGIAMQGSSNMGGGGGGHDRLLATVSIDQTGKLWKMVEAENESMDENDDNEEDEESRLPYSIEEVAHLKGHQARLCSCAFHPTGDYVGTTSFDHSWRLWDVHSGEELLLQDGHSRETYGIGFHPDGSLVATTDYGGVTQNWDLRSGKSVCNFVGHAKRVLCAEYAPNGFHLATAGDDGTIKVWDLRKRAVLASVPAHTNLITQLAFGGSGEYLASSSFDGTAKLWSTRDWTTCSILRGHAGKVMGVAGLSSSNGSIVTSGYDRTLKMWK